MPGEDVILTVSRCHVTPPFHSNVDFVLLDVYLDTRSDAQ